MTAKKAVKIKAGGTAKRVRRKPEDARRVILDAAESCMRADGPAGLRLQDVAKTAGVSHPTILHHFGSREGLVRAVNQRALDDLKTVVVANMGPGPEGLRATFAAYREGLAQRIVWLLQSGVPPAPGGGPSDAIAEALHAERLRHAKPGTTLDIADSRAVVHLVAITAFGDALLGPRLRKNAGSKDRAEAEHFERWFGEMLVTYMRAKS